MVIFMIVLILHRYNKTVARQDSVEHIIESSYAPRFLSDRKRMGEDGIWNGETLHCEATPSCSANTATKRSDES